MGDDLRPNKKQLKKLVKDHAAAVKQDPNNLVARLKLAGALKELGNGREAIEHYQAVAKSYTEAGKLVQAISVYKGILEIDPGDSAAGAAMTELSSRRAEEVQRKSPPRLQQEGGRWVMPTEARPSEEVGAEGDREGPDASPSRLRLPSQPLGDLPSGRRSRRSRPFLQVPEDLRDEGSQELESERPERAPETSLLESRPIPPPMPGWAGTPREKLPSQTSLPRLFPRESVPSSVPVQALPPLSPVAQARGGEVVELTAEAPPRAQSRQGAAADFVEETTSPGPKSYEETIRESALRLEHSPREPQTANPSKIPRRTLVGVHLPEHSEAPAPDPSIHHRPTPAVPMPAISLEALRHASGSEEASPEAGTSSLGRVVSLPGEPPRSTPPPVVPGAASDKTLDSVFNEEEEALWAALSSAPQPQSQPSPQRGQREDAPPPSPVAPRSMRPVAPLPPRDSDERRPRATLPMPSFSALPGVPSETPSQTTPTTSSSKHPSDGAVRLPSPAANRELDRLQIEDIQLFRDISEASRDLLRSRVVTRREPPGAVVVREGDPGHALFVLSSGSVSVTKTGSDGETVELATLGPGAFFGEFALLSDRKRHATVTVSEEAVFYEISRKVIADLTKSEPAFGNTLRAFYRKRLLGTLVASAPFFSALTEEEREGLLGRLRFRRVAEGTKIIAEGEPGGGFFLILIGRVQITKSEPNGSSRILGTLGDGSYFGEMSLLKGGNAVASVTTVAATELVQLAAVEFYRVLSHYPQIWEEVNQEAKRRELANLQILSGRTPSASKDGVVF